MKKFMVYMLILGITVFGTMALVNYTVDPGHIYSATFIDKVVEGAKRGLNVEGVTDIDERLYKQKLAEVYRGKSYDYVVLGTSHTMTLSEDAMEGATLLNLSVPGGKLEDMTALYQIAKNNGIHYKNAILSVDAGILNSNYRDTRWKSIESYFNEFAGKGTRNADWKLVENLFSASYLRSAKLDIIKRLKGKGKMRYVSSIANEGTTKRTDGSMYYAQELRDSPLKEVDKDALTWNHNYYKEFDEVSEERAALFNRLMDALEADGVNVIFFCCPMHPLFYKRVVALRGAVAAMKYFEEYAQENNIPIIGKYDPKDLGFDNTHFYDATHVRKEYIDSLFIPFMKAQKVSD